MPAPLLRAALSGLAALSALTPGTAGAQPPVVFTPVVSSGLALPLDLQHAPGDAARLFVAEQDGRIRTVENGALLATPALDITARVVSGGERGLLGFAFDPGWPAQPYVYVDYTRVEDGATVVSRFTRAGGPGVTFNPASEVVLIRVAQVAANHNGGQVAFGPDGHLYVALGDGGHGGDPEGHGQNRATLLGSILRLDVRGGGSPLDCGAGTGTATVPDDNPFVGAPGACDEIYAYGFRNPWRISFDAATGRLWAGDVGQFRVEEVDTVAAGRNYGWNRMEGTECFNTADPQTPLPSCDQTGLTPPVWVYGRDQGFSVTGGHVYRGTRAPGLAGWYVYGDFGGRVWALRLNGAAAPTNVQIGNVTTLSSFGVDAAGELYALGLNGYVYRLDHRAVGVRVLLEGPFAGGAMAAHLAPAGLLPTAQPYAAPAYDGTPLDYDGAEAVPPGFFAAHPDVVDWVLVELRTSPSGAAVARRAALVRASGEVVDTSGTAPLPFPSVAPGNYHVTVRHRNHSAATTADAVAFPAGAHDVDLTAEPGAGNTQVAVATGVWALRAGDVNADGVVNATDVGLWRGANGTAGYSRSDVKLDGRVTARDLQEGIRR